MEEERARQEAAAKRAAEEAAGQEKGGEQQSSSQEATMGENNNDTSREADKTNDHMDDENALLQQALAMSMDEPISTTSVCDIDMSDAAVDDQDLQLDSSSQLNQTDMSTLLADPSFLTSVITSLEGVDTNDPAVKELLASVQSQSEHKKDEEKPPSKEEKK
ncbi:hypothetical protein Cgig2_019585 [Carnegiea gigantea]|uniref:26S proteasome non-ATPase regulatory subunit 4 n=1 Tax=Carnegiea gigantea TaxID=171969 RepID=A0A9Q1KHU5_9CARY|nr:hypothetical protein Cgig2_019585 [Carnegiea gigantea]